MFAFSTVKAPTAIFLSITGSFSSIDVHEIVVSKGSLLELYRLVNDSLSLISSLDTFSTIRTLSVVRQTFSDVNHILLTSDSGHVSILSVRDSTFSVISNFILGRPGSRRGVPGQFACVDPEGRAVLISSIDDARCVVGLTGVDEKKLDEESFSSSEFLSLSPAVWFPKLPKYTVVLSVCALDTGTGNPIFAFLEAFEGDNGMEKVVSYYECVLGTFAINKLSSIPVPSSSNLLIAIPLLSNQDDKNGGLFVCGDRNLLFISSTHSIKSVSVPQRITWPASQSNLLINYSLRVLKNRVFILIASEAGDLYSINFQGSSDFSIGYFDSILPCYCLSLLIGGVLFVGSTCGNHHLYRITQPPSEENPLISQDFAPSSTRMELRQSFSSYSPLTSCSSMFDGRLVISSGSSPTPSISFLTAGLSTHQFASSPLPGTHVVDGIWALKKSSRDSSHSAIVLSFASPPSTLPLSFSGKKVAPLKGSGLITNQPSLVVTNIGTESGEVLQVTADKVIIVSLAFAPSEVSTTVASWSPPGRRYVKHAVFTKTQVILALTGGHVIALNYESVSKNLVEISRAEFQTDICAMSVLSGVNSAKALVVADIDHQVSFISLTQNGLPIMSTLNLKMPISSLCLTMSHLFAGLDNGLVMMIPGIDAVNGSFSSLSQPFPTRLSEGNTKISLFTYDESGSVFALADHCWYFSNNKFSKVVHPPLSVASHFMLSLSAGSVLSSFVGVTKDSRLNISQLVIPEDVQSSSCPWQTIPLATRYTPRKIIQDPSGWVLAIETDHACLAVDLRVAVNAPDHPFFSTEERPEVESMQSEELPPGTAGGSNVPRRIFEADRHFITSPLDVWKGAPNQWSSCISVIHPGVSFHSFNISTSKPQLTDCWHLAPGMSAFALCSVSFTDNNSSFVAVGGAFNLTYRPVRRCDSGFINLFSLTKEGTLEFVHTTLLPDSCHALCAYNGMLLVGSGKHLRLMTLGRERLLRKCEFKVLPKLVVGIEVFGDRIMVRDATQSIFYLKYRSDSNLFQLFAEDPHPRQLVSGCSLDRYSCALGDKFGNIFGVRLDADVSSDVEDDPLAHKSLRDDSSYLSSAPSLASYFFHFYVGSVVTSITKLESSVSSLTREEVLLFTCLDGSIRILKPFASRTDALLCKNLEEFLAKQVNLSAPLQRSHVSFRSMYFPVKNVVDLDLCRKFFSLTNETREEFCTANGSSLFEVERLVRDLIS
ncbi:hypothetical protein RCL1_002864 [Eukaryota sp. TZLM3-RCL]